MKKWPACGWAGQPISQIAHTLGLERKTVRRWLRAGQAPTWHQPPRPSVLDPYRAYLQQRWQEGCRNAAQLWRELCQQGFPGRPSLVRRWAGQRRQLEPAPATAGPAALTWKIPPSRRAPRLVLTKAEFLSEPDHRFVSTLLANSPDLARVVDLAGRFTRMIQQHEPSELETWLAEAKATELTPFAERLSCDLPAVHAALTLLWSTSPVEGHINRLKTVKRQMYGRANLDLLRQRLLAA